MAHKFPEHFHTTPSLPAIPGLGWQSRHYEHFLFYFAREAMMKFHRPGALSNTCPFSDCSSGGWKGKIRVSAGLVPPEASLLG